MKSEPGGKDEVVNCAWPLDNAMEFPNLLPFAENCTVPVGAGPPLSLGVTCDVNVTL